LECGKKDVKAMQHFEIVVVGGGTMGSGAAWALGKRGVAALVLEQFGHVHQLGSHGGKTRIIRHAYAEGAGYVPLVGRAEALWTELAEATELRLLHRTGGLDLAAPGFSQARAARQSAIEHHLPHEWLDGAAVCRRWPVWQLGDEWTACYSPQTGFLDVESSLRALRLAAERCGVIVHQHEPVRSWRSDGAGFVVETDRARYLADRLIVTAGAWTGPILNDLGLPLTVLRKVVFWLAVEDPAVFQPDRFPIFIADGPLGSVYGLPSFGGPGIKVGNHSGGEETTPELANRAVGAEETEEVLPFVRPSLPLVSDRVIESAVCLYTMTPDHHFIVDRHPSYPNLAFGAGFSGHGFKFAPAIGELLVDLVLSSRTQPFPRFAVSRFSRD
jgi:monomeric sarcosine oxidase